MRFTPLHQALGLPAGPITDELLDVAVREGLAETDGIDWKRQTPEVKGLPQSDFPKDVAAMANSGGGVIVFGIDEDQKLAIGRLDIGELNEEQYERALRSAAVTGIHPPIFGLQVSFVGEPGRRALVVVVPASEDGPHLIYRNEYFGAPVRNDADTVWMRERQIEQMYRARFEARRQLTEDLNVLYDETTSGKPIHERAWFIAVAHPRIPVQARERMDREEARTIYNHAYRLAPGYASTRVHHPIQMIDYQNPRPGLRRWVARDAAETDASRWKSAWATVHFDGALTIAAAIGAGRNRDGFDEAYRIDSARCESTIADFMALLRATGNALGVGEYEVKVGIEWSGEQDLIIQTVDELNFVWEHGSIPLPRFVPVVSTVRNDVDHATFITQCRELALDVVNQGGVQDLRAIVGAEVE
ncbi:AlbA family DNA-binding domain-containing protein [Nocardioides sp. AN3]